MGGKRVMVQGLEIAQVDKENNLLAVKGAVPGKKGTLLEIVAIKEIEAVKEEREEKLVAELEKKEKEAKEKKGGGKKPDREEQREEENK
jgi:hypothetical protein